MNYFPESWLRVLDDVIMFGDEVSPRGQLTKEIQQLTLNVDMRKPVLTVEVRGINPKFMAAEAYWILTGDDRVETIAPFNKNIAAFSDDGVTYFGAYGPKIKQQLFYVLTALERDPDTRQAGLTIWRESPPKTKDVPCTVAIFFSIRKRRLNAHVFMRSSDLWLGVPYDVFNFSMLSFLVCGHLRLLGMKDLEPGQLFLTAASSHLYARNFEDAKKCLAFGASEQKEAPEILWSEPEVLMQRLKDLRHTTPESPLRWWR